MSDVSVTLENSQNLRQLIKYKSRWITGRLQPPREMYDTCLLIYLITASSNRSTGYRDKLNVQILFSIYLSPIILNYTIFLWESYTKLGWDTRKCFVSLQMLQLDDLDFFFYRMLERWVLYLDNDNL